MQRGEIFALPAMKMDSVSTIRSCCAIQKHVTSCFDKEYATTPKGILGCSISLQAYSITAPSKEKA